MYFIVISFWCFGVVSNWVYCTPRWATPPNYIFIHLFCINIELLLLRKSTLPFCGVCAFINVKRPLECHWVLRMSCSTTIRFVMRFVVGHLSCKDVLNLTGCRQNCRQKRDCLRKCVNENNLR